MQNGSENVIRRLEAHVDAMLGGEKLARPFKVVVTSVLTREYEIDANTPEEAESVAEQWAGEDELRNDSGYIVSDELQDSEALPLEELEDVGRAASL